MKIFIKIYLNELFKQLIRCGIKNSAHSFLDEFAGTLANNGRFMANTKILVVLIFEKV